MLKVDELMDRDSCFNKAKTEERIFVLLARDPAAPAAIRAWIAERIRIGKNKLGDPKLVEAEQCADQMELERDAIARLNPPRVL